MMKNVRARPAAITAALAILVAIAWSLQPATADIGTPTHLWKEHLRQRADARYLRTTRVYVSPVFTLSAVGDDDVTVACPAGWRATGGGVDFEAPDVDVQVISNAPAIGATTLFAAAEGSNPPPRDGASRCTTTGLSTWTEWWA